MSISAKFYGITKLRSFVWLESPGIPSSFSLSSWRIRQYSHEWRQSTVTFKFSATSITVKDAPTTLSHVTLCSTLVN